MSIGVWKQIRKDARLFLFPFPKNIVPRARFAEILLLLRKKSTRLRDARIFSILVVINFNVLSVPRHSRLIYYLLFILCLSKLNPRIYIYIYYMCIREKGRETTRFALKKLDVYRGKYFFASWKNQRAPSFRFIYNPNLALKLFREGGGESNKNIQKNI